MSATASGAEPREGEAAGGAGSTGALERTRAHHAERADRGDAHSRAEMQALASALWATAVVALLAHTAGGALALLHGAGRLSPACGVILRIVLAAAALRHALAATGLAAIAGVRADAAVGADAVVAAPLRALRLASACLLYTSPSPRD